VPAAGVRDPHASPPSPSYLIHSTAGSAPLNLAATRHCARSRSKCADATQLGRRSDRRRAARIFSPPPVRYSAVCVVAYPNILVTHEQVQMGRGYCKVFVKNIVIWGVTLCRLVNCCHTVLHHIQKAVNLRSGRQKFSVSHGTVTVLLNDTSPEQYSKI